MSTTVVKDDLLNVPMLEPDGRNWVMFKTRLEWALAAKNVSGHLLGSKVKPKSTPEAPVESAVSEQWEKDEFVARHMLGQRLRDSTLRKIIRKSTVAEMWTTITKEFETKSDVVQANLRSKFMNLRCADKGNLRTHLDKMSELWEELASVGVAIDNKEYTSVIIKSLPKEYASFVSSLAASAHLIGKALDPDTMKTYLLEEYDNQLIFSKPEKSKEKDVALATYPSRQNSKPQPNGGTSQTKSQTPSKLVCWNCGGTGHRRDQCPSPQVEKTDKPKGKDTPRSAPRPKAAESANKCIEADEDGVWTTYLDSDFDDLPDLLSESDSEDELTDDEYNSSSDYDDQAGWLTEVDDTSEAFSEAGSDTGSLVSVSPPTSRRVTVEEIPDEDATLRVMPDSGEDAVTLVDIAALTHSNPVLPNKIVELYDSGTTRHLSPYREKFTTYRDIPPKPINAANCQKFNATGVGEMVIEVPNGVDATKMRLTEVLYSPEVGFTLVSIGKIDDAGYTSAFGNGQCQILDGNGIVVGTFPKAKGLYRVVHESVDEQVNAATEKHTVMELHRLMGHIAPAAAKRLVEKGFVAGVSLDLSSSESTFCESCIHAKSKRQPIPKMREGERAKEYGGEIHSDVWGPSSVRTQGGRRYYVSFTDDATRETRLYLLRKKDETFATYKQYEAWVKTHRDMPIKILRSDRGGEYLSGVFIKHLANQGTTHKLTVHDTPEENGVSERLNGILLEKVRAMLHASGLPKSLWGEAVRHAVWLKNRTSTKALDGKTPFEAVHGEKPDLSDLHEWGCRVWVHDASQSKLDSRALEGRWLGFDEQSKGHRVYWPEKRSVTVERSVKFEGSAPLVFVDDTSLEGEGETPDKLPVSTPSQPVSGTSETPAGPPPIVQDTLPDVGTSDSGLEPAFERPRRDRRPTQYVLDIREGRGSATGQTNKTNLPIGLQAPESNVAIEAEAPDGEDEYVLVAVTAEVEAIEPRTLAEAKRSPDWLRWEQAVKDEIEMLERLRTWEVVDSPPDANVVGCKWVFRIKKNAAGEIERFKARLVAQGFSQVPGIDYFDTYAPVAKLSSVRTVLAMAARLDLEIHQVDIKGAYLYGVLDENEVVYMKQPPGVPNEPGKVLRLKKSLYGLKQSGRRWYEKLFEVLKKLFGLARCEVDHAVFFRRSGKEMIIFVAHVDDLTVVTTGRVLMDQVKCKLQAELEVTDLGEIHWLLGIEIRRDRENRALMMCQKSYIDSVIKRFGLEDAKPLASPMEPSAHLSNAQSPVTSREIADMRDVPYREAVGSLMYAAVGTRPDIAFAVAILSRFSINPGRAHWNAVKRVMRYLKGTVDLWLTFGYTTRDTSLSKSHGLIGYADADGSMQEDRRAISGYAFLIDGGAVSWSSKRQEIVVLSTTEAEYVAATHAAKEALWLRTFLKELFGTTMEPTPLYCDNQSAIALAKDHQYHARTKHIDIRFHFIRWIVDNGSIALVYCPTEDMVADTLTKPLPSAKAKHFAIELGLRIA